MKSLLKRPGYGLTSAAIWSLLIGILGSTAVLVGGLSPLFLILTLTYVVIGVMIWQEQRWAVWMGFALYGLGFASRVVTLFIAFQWKHVFYGLFFGFTAYECWNALRMMNEPPDDLGETDDVAGEEPESPMISFVLLRRTQRFLEDIVLSRIVESAWGGDFTNEDESQADGFVVGESPMFIIQAPSGAYMVHNHDEPYWDSVDEVVEHIGELRLRKAVADHQAWMSVDLVVPSDENQTPSQQYSMILKLVLELADEDTLAIFRPETMEINVWSDDLAERLTEPDAYLMFSEQNNVPVIPISGDDPILKASVATAKQRWPEFVEAFASRQPTETTYSVKAKLTVGDSTEYIWIDVIGMEPKYLHGRLANDPVDLGDLILGSQVEVPIEDIQDWCYVKDGEPVGLFSLEAIRQAQEEQQSTDEAS